MTVHILVPVPVLYFGLCQWCQPDSANVVVRPYQHLIS